MGPPLRPVPDSAWSAPEQQVPVALFTRLRSSKPLIRAALNFSPHSYDPLQMNFARDLVDAAPADRLAMVALDRDGGRREITFGEVSDRSSRLASTLAARGVARGDVA